MCDGGVRRSFLSMARSVRRDVQGGWGRVTARGIERRAIFADEPFLGLLAAMQDGQRMPG